MSIVGAFLQDQFSRRNITVNTVPSSSCSPERLLQLTREFSRLVRVRPVMRGSFGVPGTSTSSAATPRRVHRNGYRRDGGLSGISSGGAGGGISGGEAHTAAQGGVTPGSDRSTSGGDGGDHAVPAGDASSSMSSTSSFGVSRLVVRVPSILRRLSSRTQMMQTSHTHQPRQAISVSQYDMTFTLLHAEFYLVVVSRTASGASASSAASTESDPEVIIGTNDSACIGTSTARLAPAVSGCVVGTISLLSQVFYKLFPTRRSAGRALRCLGPNGDVVVTDAVRGYVEPVSDLRTYLSFVESFEGVLSRVVSATGDILSSIIREREFVHQVSAPGFIASLGQRAGTIRGRVKDVTTDVIEGDDPEEDAVASMAIGVGATAKRNLGIVKNVRVSERLWDEIVQSRIRSASTDLWSGNLDLLGKYALLSAGRSTWFKNPAARLRALQEENRRAKRLSLGGVKEKPKRDIGLLVDRFGPTMFIGKRRGVDGGMASDYRHRVRSRRRSFLETQTPLASPSRRILTPTSASQQARVRMGSLRPSISPMRFDIRVEPPEEEEEEEEEEEGSDVDIDHQTPKRIKHRLTPVKIGRMTPGSLGPSPATPSDDANVVELLEVVEVEVIEGEEEGEVVRVVERSEMRLSRDEVREERRRRRLRKQGKGKPPAVPKLRDFRKIELRDGDGEEEVDYELNQRISNPPTPSHSDEESDDKVVVGRSPGVLRQTAVKKLDLLMRLREDIDAVYVGEVAEKYRLVGTLDVFHPVDVDREEARKTLPDDISFTILLTNAHHLGKYQANKGFCTERKQEEGRLLQCRCSIPRSIVLNTEKVSLLKYSLSDTRPRVPLKLTLSGVVKQRVFSLSCVAKVHPKFAQSLFVQVMIVPVPKTVKILKERHRPPDAAVKFNTEKQRLLWNIEPPSEDEDAEGTPSEHVLRMQFMADQELDWDEVRGVCCALVKFRSSRSDAPVVFSQVKVQNADSILEREGAVEYAVRSGKFQVRMAEEEEEPSEEDA